MKEKKIPPFGSPSIMRVQTRNETDYIRNETLYRGSGSGSVMVTSSSDLSDITGYAPGTIAYTAGFGSMWQLAASGSWVEI